MSSRLIWRSVPLAGRLERSALLLHDSGLLGRNLAGRFRHCQAGRSKSLGTNSSSSIVGEDPQWLVQSLRTRSRASSGRGWQYGGHNRSRRSSLPPCRWRWEAIALIPLSVVRLDDGSSGREYNNPDIAHKLRGSDVEDPNELHLPGHDEDLEDDAYHRANIFRKLWILLNRWVIEPLGTTRRFLYLAFLFLPVIATAPVLAFEWLDKTEIPHVPRGTRRKRQKERRTTRWWYRFLVKQMERAGPTFIKVRWPLPRLQVHHADWFVQLAQWAGSRRDLFPDQLCEMFGRLHSNGKPHTLKYTKRVLEKAFNKPFNEIFAEFDETPMGIGAIAQAYKAVLNPDLVPPEYFGPKYNPQAPRVLPLPAAPAREPHEAVPSTTVAIKVLHPNVEKTINRDLNIMGFFARVLNAFPGMEWLSFPQEVDVFGTMMRSQLDLTTEAKNLDKFEENFKHRTVVSFPRPLNAYTSKRVLVEEYEDAVPLKAFLREGGGPFDYRIASLGLDAFLVRISSLYCSRDLSMTDF